MLTLAQPWWMLLLPMPFLLWILADRGWLAALRRAPHRAAPAIIHPQATLIAGLMQDKGRRPVPWAWLAGCLLLILALARPQWWDFEHPAIRQGHDLLLAIDISGSMRAQDFSRGGQPVSRLDLLKQHLKAFVARREHDRMGIVLFADDALTFAPMSSDRALLNTFIDDIRAGLAGEKTALGEAIALAVERLRVMPPESRILVLMTDGANTAGDITPAAAARLAREAGIRTFIIGIGSDGKVLFPRGPVEKPEVVTLPPDEALLRRLAADTRGRFYRAASPQDMARILKDIDRLAPTLMRDPAHAYREDWYWLPLLAGVALLAWAETERRRILPT